MSDTDGILEDFKEDVVEVLRDNLVCLLHHGSRAKGEARPDSDYDSIVVTKRVNKSVIVSLQSVFSKYPRFSFYLLSLNDLETLPRSHYLEFLYAKPLYGSVKMKMPEKEEVLDYINHKRRDTLDTIRHTLILPHTNERKVKLVYYALKNLYICLSYFAYSENGKLPSTRKQAVAYFKRNRRQTLGIRLLTILDKWDSYKEDVMSDPGSYLFLLEEFFRQFQPRVRKA